MHESGGMIMGGWSTGRIAAVAFSLLAIVADAKERFVFVEGGLPVCAIEVPGVALVDADAAFFTNEVFLCTGAAIPILCSCETDSAGTVRGRIVFEVHKTDLFHEDDYSVDFPDDRTMRISGSDMSCRWALNRILEEDFGVVFCYPGSWGTHHPQSGSVSRARVAFSGAMGIKLERDLWAEDPAWQRALCGKRQTGEFKNHNVGRIFPIATYAKSPWLEKIMPEIGGKRFIPTLPVQHWQNCYASRESVDEAVKNICAKLSERPELKVYSLSANDNGGYCHCEGGAAMNGGSFPAHGRFGNEESHSESYYTWANAVAAGVVAKHPDVVFGLLAYCETIDPPSFRLHPSIVPFLCVDLHQLVDAKRLENRIELFTEWSKKADNFGIWDYGYGCDSYVPPRDYLSIQRMFFSLKKRFPALNAFFAEGSSFIGEGPKRYLYYKLMADPGCDADTVLDKWYRACVGDEAAPFLKEYYALAEAFWTGPDVRKTPWFRTNKSTYLNFSEMTYLFGLKRETMNRMDALMVEVIEAANRSGDAMQRVRAANLGVFQDFYRARARFCGAYLTDCDGRFKSAAEATAFVAAIPEMSVAAGQTVAAAEKILASREPFSAYEKKRFADWPKRMGSSNPNSGIFFNELVPYLQDAGVRTAMSESSADSRTLPTWSATLKGLLAGDAAQDRSMNGISSAAEALDAWKKIKIGRPLEVEPVEEGVVRLVSRNGGSAAARVVTGMLSGRHYLYVAKVRNASSRPVAVQMYYLSCHPTFVQSDPVPTERSFKLEPGGVSRCAVFCRMNLKSTAGRLHFVVDGMEDGDSVVVEELKFLDLESPVSGFTNK